MEAGLVARLLVVGANMTTEHLGKGPGGAITGPLWGGGIHIPSASTLASYIAGLRAIGGRGLISWTDARTNWTDLGPKIGTLQTLIYNRTKWLRQLNRWTVAGNDEGVSISPALADIIDEAHADGVIGDYVVDEPKHDQFNESITSEDVDEMCWDHKNVFGTHAQTVVRSGYDKMLPIPIGGYPNVDYGIAMYEGPHFPSQIPANNSEGPGGTALPARPRETHAVFYPREKQSLGNINVGMIPFHNQMDAGDFNTIDGLSACHDYLGTGSSSGMIKGTFPTGTDYLAAGTYIACGSRPANEVRFWSQPAYFLKAINAAKNIDAPMFGFWTFPYPKLPGYAVWNALFQREDIKKMFRDAILIGEASTAPNAWRTPKGGAPGGSASRLFRVGIDLDGLGGVGRQRFNPSLS